jgi:hypothetical protein
MINKVIWKLILGLILLSVPFLIGLGISSFEISDNTTNRNANLLLLSFIYNVALALSTAVIIIAYLTKKKNIKNAFAYIFIFLILLSLAFGGSCILTVGGHQVRGLFIK